MKTIQKLHSSISLMILMLCSVCLCFAELRLLMSVFRHGDRYPLERDTIKVFYPRTPYYDFMWLPNSPADITTKGKQRVFALGKLLQEKYGKWLGPTYSRDLVTFTSSHSERCFVSAELVGAALFSSSSEQSWNSNTTWTPIAVQRYHHQQNTLFFGSTDCENYLTTLGATLRKDPTLVEYDERMQDFYANVSYYTGGSVNNSVLAELNAEFTAVVDVGAELPHWARPIYYNGNLTEAEVREFTFYSWTDELKIWTGGVWLREWFYHVDAYLSADTEKRSKTDQSVKEKASFYAGHDANIAGILSTLGIFYPHVPIYASAINFELHEDDKSQFFVKVLHRNSGNFIPYMVRGCDNILCPLETFKDLFAGIIPANGTPICGRHMFPS